MTTARLTFAAAAALALLALPVPAPVEAQFDHLKCYKIKDPVKLDGIVDLNSPQCGLEACGQQADCPLGLNEECCCNGICV